MSLNEVHLRGNGKEIKTYINSILPDIIDGEEYYIVLRLSAPSSHNSDEKSFRMTGSALQIKTYLTSLVPDIADEVFYHFDFTKDIQNRTKF
jgi:hypothetical protein